MTHHEVFLRRAQFALACQCPCRDPGATRHDGCRGDIAAGDLVIEHVDSHGNTSVQCEVCGAKADARTDAGE